MKAAKDEFRGLRNKGIRVHGSKPREMPGKPVRDLNSLLRHIYDVHDKPVRDEDFPKYFKVFQTVSLKLQELMKQVDPYYERFSVVRFEGRRDQFRINKPDDFDMEIVIGLPVTQDHPGTQSDLMIEDIAPGFVKLHIGTQFQNLLDQDEEGQIIQTAFRWLDKDNYLLRSLFLDWFKSVVDKAMNLFDVVEDNLSFGMMVEGQPYTLRLAENSSPAYTLIVADTQHGFRLDIDLVPALEFLAKESRRMPSKKRKETHFLVMPKSIQGGPDLERSWRLPLKLQNWDLLYMKQTIRLIKKLRDNMRAHAELFQHPPGGQDKITSYHIKTMFLHEALAQEHDPDFWSRDVPAKPFIHMVKKFHQHLESRNIPYFWNTDNNLIGNVDEATLDDHAKKLKRLIKVVEDPSEYKIVAKFLMTESQFKEYKNKILNI